MKLELPLEEMTIAEKLRTMELLWADLSRNAPDELTPQWHLDVLEERAQRLAEGKEEVLDWEEAKKKLRQEIENER